MLAYDLYLRNTKTKEKRNLPPPRQEKPVKKIFVNKNTLKVDQKTFQEYGGNKIKKLERLQEELSMSSSTSEKLALPDYRTGSNSPNPYVEFAGKFKREKDEIRVEITINGEITTSGKKKKSKYTAITQRLSPKINTNTQVGTWQDTFECQEDHIGLRIHNLEESKDGTYYIGRDKHKLHEAYVQAEIIDEQDRLDKKLFKNICQEFFEFVKTKPLQGLIPENKKEIFFSLYVLPSDDDIKYEETRKIKLDEPIIDAFGNETGYHPTGKTVNAKFMSYDDLAFTLNCKEEAEFYKLLHIGFESFGKVNFYPQDYFFLSGLLWYFQFQSTKDDITFDRKSGIYDQLSHCYSKMAEKGTIEQEIAMKVICMKKNQAKIEILIEENLTMEKLKNILKEEMLKEKKEKNNPSRLAFESLIIVKSRSTLWAYYLEAVKALLQSRTLERTHFVPVITKIFKDKLPKWLEKKLYKEANEFLNQTFFCIRLLTRIGKNEIGDTCMDITDTFAYCIGKIAGEYVRFKKAIDENNNSLQTILTYSKYDREKLRFVHKQVCLGINLAKPAQEKEGLDDIIKFVHDHMPKEEIIDVNAYKDNSYFFYKGVFEQLGG